MFKVNWHTSHEFEVKKCRIRCVQLNSFYLKLVILVITKLSLKKFIHLKKILNLRKLVLSLLIL
jgi:hypothetical protein